jgi:hypothetical protein
MCMVSSASFFRSWVGLACVLLLQDTTPHQQERDAVGGRAQLPISAQRSRYGDWLRASQPWGPTSSSGRIKNFHFSTSSRSALRPTQPPTQWVPGTFSVRVKQPGGETAHSPPTSWKVKKKWVYTSTPHMSLWSTDELVTRRVSFVFFFFLACSKNTLERTKRLRS